MNTDERNASTATTIAEGTRYTYPDGSTISAVASSYTALTTDRIVEVTSTAAARTITLPALSSETLGWRIRIVDASGAAGTFPISIVDSAAAAVATIDTNGGSVEIMGRAAAWRVLSSTGGGGTSRPGAARIVCRAATTANHGLSGLAAIDGVTPVAGDRILVKSQSTGSQNGIYTAASSTWSRSPEADAAAEVSAGLEVFVSEGTTQGNRWYILTTDNPITVGTTALTFTVAPDAAELASTANGKGASLVGIEDAATTITAATVEGALAEITAANWVTTARITDANVTLAKIANGTGLSVIGRAANSAGVNADIAAASDDQVLRRSGTSIAFGTVAAAGLTDAILTGAKAAVLEDDAVVGGIPVVINIAIADGVTADKDITLTHKTEIVDVIIQKRGAAGGASDTIQVKNGSDVVTDAIDINVADKVVKRAGTIDDAFSTIAAAGTLRVTKTKASANNVACQVTIIGIRRT